MRRGGASAPRRFTRASSRDATCTDALRSTNAACDGSNGALAAF
jgi:hypothetical protein